MKKRLLMVTFALLTVATSFAFQPGEYAYNSTQKFKILGKNLVTNGNFASNRDGWYGADKETGLSATEWDLVQGAGPNGETVLQTLGADVTQPLCNSWTLEPGSYIVSYQIKMPAAAYVSPATLTTKNNVTTISFPTNYADFFINTTGDHTRVVTSDEAPVKGVTTTTYIPAEEWKTIIYFFTIEQGETLVMHFEKLTAGTQITNFAIHSASTVYDTRIIENRIAFARKLMEMPEFNTEAAQDAKATLNGIIGFIEETLSANGYEDADAANNDLTGLNDEGIEPFLAVTSQNIKKNSYFNYIEDLTKFPKYNRGNIKNEQVIGGFKFRGDNWLHGSGATEIAKQIQTSFVNPAGSISLYNETLPASKYFISAEVRNAYCDKSYNMVYNLERDVKLYVGTDTVDCGNISGENWVRLYHIGELKEGEKFDAGIWWQGLDTKEGARFEVRNFEVRSLSTEDVEAKAEHIKAWNLFKEQWNAATSNRNKLEGMIGSKDYPWAQDSLTKAKTQWDPYYNDVIKKGWLNANGEDAGIATTDELNDWAEHQGYVLADTTETSSDAEKAWYKNYSKYAVVRGYQYAINYVVDQNKVIANLAAAIEAATASLEDAMNSSGNKAPFKKAIDEAQATLDEVKGSTSDATREADEAKLNKQLEALAAAKTAFEESAKLTPIVDIDFSTPATTGEEVAYIIKGAAGQLELSNFEADNSASDITSFQLGVGEELLDVLRIGNGSATVNLAEVDQPTENDVIRVNFDMWVGGLIGKYVYFDLRNAADQRVAGFKYGLYDGQTAYNDFDDAAHTGLNIATCGKSTGKTENAALHTDTYKFSFDLVVDYKAKSLQALLPTSPTGTKAGGLVALPELDDNKIAKIVIGSDYNNSGRRSWFDNLKVFKYASTAEGPIETAIQNIASPATTDAAIYTISGAKVTKATKPGLYIQNGKKILVK